MSRLDPSGLNNPMGSSVEQNLTGTSLSVYKVSDTAAMLWFLQRNRGEGHKGNVVLRDFNLPDNFFIKGIAMLVFPGVLDLHVICVGTRCCVSIFL